MEQLRKKGRKQFLLTMLLVFLFLAFMSIFNLVTYYRASVASVEALGESSLAYESAKIESYVQKGRDVLCVTADTVEFMLDYGVPTEEILSYLVEESAKQQAEMDENFNGIYGWIGGEYLDGVGWEPPADFVPKERDWYIAAAKEPGQPVIVQPYVDAQTHTVMISVAYMLSDGDSVVSLDIALNKIQNITENIRIGGVGYGFIMDDAGLIIAHYDGGEKGKAYPTDENQTVMVKKIRETGSGSFQTMIDGEKCSVFTSTVMVVNNTRLFEELRNNIIMQAATTVIIFLIIFGFCYLAYRRLVSLGEKEQENDLRIQKLNSNIVKALAFTIDAKDRYTSGHSQRVANYALEIAKRMGKSEEEQNMIYYAGLLHDVGKIRVPEEVLNKPGKLSTSEFNQIKVHTVSGYHILKDIYDEPQIAIGAKYHHERYDGTGYPDGLSGENIPEVARILGVADSYDAMASNRSYRSALPQETVREEIEKCRGTQFDPKIADIMLQMIADDPEYQMRQQESVRKNILVIDDDKINITVVEQILKDDPLYRVIGALSFAEGMKILEKEQVDLVLLDLLMPDIDGFDAFRKLREKWPVPIVFITADKSIETIQKAVEIGADDYVTKPFLPIALKERIHGVIYSI